MSIKHLKNSYPTIAVLTNMMATPFSEGIIFGATDYAKQHHYNTLCFSGAEFAKPAQTNMSRDRIFELIDQDAIDGVIIPMGALSRFITLEEQLVFLKQFSHVPIITIASNIPGYMDVGYSSEQGMYQLVEHLVEEHDTHRFAFAGPTGVHLSTRNKKQFFESALATHGIDFDPNMYITSDMSSSAPIPLLDELFSEERKKWPEAIIVSTDNQAISIITALKNKGIKTPEDVIVTGSMGNLSSLFSDPPLTSIVEPTYELGWNAAKQLITSIEKNISVESIILPTSLAVRHSCGCHQSNYNQLVNTTKETSFNPNMIQTALELVLNSIPPERKEFIKPEISQILSTMLLTDLSNQSSHQLIDQFNQLLESSLKTDEFFLWGQLALTIHYQLMQLIDNENNKKVINIASSLFKIVQHCNEKASHYRSFETEKVIGSMREIGIQLNSEFNLDEIALQLHNELNFNDCYISIFEELGEDKNQMSSILTMQNQQRLTTSKIPYPVTELIPPNAKVYNEVFALVVMPLSFKEDFIGTCVLDLAVRKGAIYEGLLTLFSSALKNQIHLRHLSEAEEKFRDIAHSASDLLWEIDSEANFKYCSSGVEQVLGYSPQEIIGKSIIDFVIQPTRDYKQELLRSMQRQHKTDRHESQYQHKDGSKRVLLTTGNPIIKFGKIIGYRGAYKDITQLKEQQARIKMLAYRDPLTHLPNRVLFNEHLSLAVSCAKIKQEKLALLFVDLDGFKLVNDSMGHDAGDLLLIEVSNLFTQCLRTEDILARFGGDEFVLILPNINNGNVAEDYVENVAKRLIKTLSSPITIREQLVYISASIGISIFPDDGKETEILLKRADKAMYHSKQNGKNRFYFYEQRLEEALNRTIMIRNLLHSAIRDDNFYLVYQPQINNQTGKISGVEALIRLAPEKYQGITPDEFIPLAEEAGLIEKIGLWVFKTACQQQRHWSASNINLTCSINVSAKQFQNPKLASEFIQVIEENAINPNMITLEITENAIFDNQQRARKTLQTLSDYGLNIAIDDFGTGYASLSCLRQIPIDILKIDRSFINDCIDDKENASIVPAIIMMAKGLKLKVVAEGVETQAQWNLLNELDCEELQGYFFSKPIQAREIPMLLTNWSINQAH